MSRSYPAGHPHGQQAYSKPPIVVTDNDVLAGRGVNIAAHKGNERFRTLVTTRADDTYCDSYSVTEKKAVAEEIVRHIGSLQPPGRFLKREGRGQVSRGLNGPWEELSRREAIKKTCQALRDCNRADRATYAHGVAAPADVKAVAEELAGAGVALRERAAKAARECAAENAGRLKAAMEAAGVPPEAVEEQLKRQKADPTYVVPGFAMTANGEFAPIAQPGYPAVMQVIGPDGVPVPTHDPVPTPGQMPGIYSMYPHPAVDMAPINMEAHLAARAAAGYIHPDDRKRMEKEAMEKLKKVEEKPKEGEEKPKEEGGETKKDGEKPKQEGEGTVSVVKEAAAAEAEGEGKKTEMEVDDDKDKEVAASGKEEEKADAPKAAEEAAATPKVEEESNDAPKATEEAAGEDSAVPKTEEGAAAASEAPDKESKKADAAPSEEKGDDPVKKDDEAEVNV